MKKSILAAVAAGALAAGAASAQDLGVVLNNILGAGVYGGPSAHDTVQGSYRDEYGRLWVVDGAGRHTMVGAAGSGPVATDRWGRPLYGAQADGRFYRDSDGDGVVDARDRRPLNPRRS